MTIAYRPLGNTGIELTALGCGGTAMGNMYNAVTEEDAQSTLRAAWDAGVRYYDTAPLYGHGLSEHRFGTAMWDIRDEHFILSTKVGWRLVPARGADIGAHMFPGAPPFVKHLDYSYDGVMRSFEDSLQRLRRDEVDILLLHDCDRRNQGDEFPARFREAMAGAYKALIKLRDEGVVKAIGCGLNEWEACEAFARAGDFNCFLLAGRYTLLDQQSLDSFLPLCVSRGIGIVLGGPYNSGILISGAVPGALYDYAPAKPEIIERVRKIEAVCARHKVPLKAAALQFPLHHHAVTSVIPGMRFPAEVAENLAMIDFPIPKDFWQELRDAKLIRPESPIP
jgi:D-threo-aldose 1-dehydrogenase